MSNNGKEIITNALLEASQNLLNKIDTNIEEINQLNRKLNPIERIPKKKRESKEIFLQQD